MTNRRLFLAQAGAIGLTASFAPLAIAAPRAPARNTGAVQTVQNNLSSLAQQLITSVNAAYNPSGTGSNFFAAGTGGNLLQLASGITASTVSATATPGSGGNELATAVAADDGWQEF